MSYSEELEKLERECRACRSLTHAGNVETVFRSFLRLEQPRAHRAGRLSEFLDFERAVRARLAQLRKDWPTGFEKK